jgi:hypothetical protein
MKRFKCGSSDIYSIEYKCTQLEIDKITINIETVNVSNKKPQETSRTGVSNHALNLKEQAVSKQTTS